MSALLSFTRLRSKIYHLADFRTCTKVQVKKRQNLDGKIDTQQCTTFCLLQNELNLRTLLC